MKFYKYILVLFSLIFTVACAGANKKPPVVAAPDLKAELSKAEIDFQAGASKKAIQRLKSLTTKHSNTDAAADANILLGNIHFKQKEYDESYKAFISVLNSEYFSPREVEAAIGAANSLEKLARYDESLELTARALKSENQSSAKLIELYTLRYKLQTQLGDRLDACRSLVFLVNNISDKNTQDKARIRAIEFIESKLHDNELEIIAKNTEFDFLRPLAMSRVAMTYFEQRNYDLSETYFRGVLSLAPNTDIATSAESHLRQIEARRRVEPYTVGAVLPLTGPYALRAQESLRGLEMGLGIRSATSSPTNFKIAVLDSDANPDVARRAVERLVIEDSVIAIVGDILSKTAEAVAQKSDELSVPVITMSQKSGLTDIGESVFQNAMTSRSIVAELVSSAMNTYGMKKFAIMYPNNGYGVEYANVFWDEVLRRGGQIVGAQPYSPEETDFNGSISRLIGTYYLEDRTDEYSKKVTEWYSQQKVITSRVTPPKDLLPPIVDFDAVFIPDSTKALKQIASMFRYHDVTGPRFLGTNIWNAPLLLSNDPKIIDGSLFVDTKTSFDPKFKTSKFYRDYISLYGTPPSQFHAQAYDIGVALRYAIERGNRSRVGLRESLVGLSGIEGASENIYINENKEFSKAMSLLTVKDGKIELATDIPAPTDARQ
jgi:branched-chain amino acid transport system substrate-binding protein